MQYATTSDGVRVAYMSLGDGPPVVFASNIFGDLSAYLGGWPAAKEGTDRAVNQGWRVILYDVRGMGFSDRNVADVELAGRVLDVEAVVAASISIGSPLPVSISAPLQRWPTRLEIWRRYRASCF